MRLLSALLLLLVSALLAFDVLSVLSSACMHTLSRVLLPLLLCCYSARRVCSARIGSTLVLRSSAPLTCCAPSRALLSESPLLLASALLASALLSC